MRRIMPTYPTLAVRSLSRLVLGTLVATMLLVHTSAALAASTPEQICQKGRYSAGAQYSACQQKALAKLFAKPPSTDDWERVRAATSKCRVKYTAVWPKLQAKAPGSTCDTTRFTDNGTTVTDNLTGLQWEKKTDDATFHDKDNLYSWSAGGGGFTAADGTAFTTFLPALNSGGCFAGQCDWRLPTIAELQTILSEAHPCTTSPCIDPVFGLTVANHYWSATTYATYPDFAWDVFFIDGGVYNGFKQNFDYVRAVRAGL